MVIQLADYIEESSRIERTALQMEVIKYLDHANMQELRALAARLSWLADLDSSQAGDPNDAPCPNEPDGYTDAAYQEHVGQSWGVFTLCRDHLSERRVRELCKLLSSEAFST